MLRLLYRDARVDDADALRLRRRYLEIGIAHAFLKRRVLHVESVLRRVVAFTPT
jgi:hypothetical protein